LPAAVTGTSKWCLSVARKWAKERTQWGSPIGEHEAVASKLSYIASTVFAMDAVTWLTANMADDKTFDIRLEAAMAKLFCTEESWKIVNEAVQIRGGRGYETGPSLAGRGKHGFPLERAVRDSRINTILEGASDIMRLFIARESLDFHLKSMKHIFDPRTSIVKKIKIAISAGFMYAFWYPKLWIPSFFGPRLKHAKPLKKHMRFANQAAKRLARELFHKMAIFQKKLVSKQGILNRFIDISVDLFTISCACSYAESLAGADEKKENAIYLADLYCKQAEERIKRNFRETHRNSDKVSNTIAKNLLAENYEWLETDIIT